MGVLDPVPWRWDEHPLVDQGLRHAWAIGTHQEMLFLLGRCNPDVVKLSCARIDSDALPFFWSGICGPSQWPELQMCLGCSEICSG